MAYTIVKDTITIDLPAGVGHSSANGPIIYCGVLDETTGNIYNISDKLSLELEYSPADSTSFLNVLFDDMYSTNPETAHALVLNTSNPTTFPDKTTKIYLKDTKGNYAEGHIEIITHSYTEPDTTTIKHRFMFDPTDFVKEPYYYLFVCGKSMTEMCDAVIDRSKTLLLMLNMYGINDCCILYTSSSWDIKSYVCIFYNNGHLSVNLNMGYINPAISSGPDNPGLSVKSLSNYTYNEIKNMYVYVFRYVDLYSKATAAVASTIPIKDMKSEPETDYNHFIYYDGTVN